MKDRSRRTASLLLWLLASAAGGGCRGTVGGLGDGGGPSDTAVDQDGQISPDGSANPDGGTTADAAGPPDASTSPDGQTLPDGQTPADSGNGCFPWSGQGPLQDAVNAHTCVEIQAGTYTLSAPVVMPSGHTLCGVGPAQATLRASPQNWQPNCCDSVVASVSSVNVTVRDFTIDCSGIATYAVAARGMTVEGMVMANGRCSSVGIAGYAMVIRDNVIENNAHTVNISGRGTFNCATIPPGVDEGAGIYAEGAPDSYAPIIENNTIRDNYGPALDVNGVWGGEFRGNNVYGNAAWAAVSLYGASNWVVEGNTITHPNNEPPQPYHPACADGPAGGHSAAIFLCQDTDTNNLVTTNNQISGNAAASFYGILSVGLDETQPYWAPRLNTFSGNDVMGSNVGCADDFVPGQWPNSDNVWTNNNCQGTPDTAPAYF